MVAVFSLQLSGCKKGEGDRCRGASECDEGLGCEAAKDGAVHVCSRCAESNICKNQGRCMESDGLCVKGESMPPADPDNTEGCPCGCDQSEDMAEKIRELDAADADRAIRSALATIGEREHAGYITEAMIQHRLRLLKLAAELMPTTKLNRYYQELSAETMAARARRVRIPATAAKGLRVRSQLLLHGETVEMLRGREKPLRACFRLWLDLENTSKSSQHLQAPTLRSSIGFPVSRWYTEDSSGAAWDGKLAAGERRSVLVIGYLNEPVPPGVTLQASIQIGAVTRDERATTRRRWDQSLPVAADAP